MKRHSTPQPTIESTLTKLFPNGTTPGNDDFSISRAPLFPTDTFGAAAYLLENSGLYQYIVADLSVAKENPAICTYSSNIYAPDRELIDECIALGQRWRHNPKEYMKIQEFWDELLKYKDEPLILSNNTKHRPNWLSWAYRLMVVSDEACADIGYYFERNSIAEPATAPYWVDSYFRAFHDRILRRFEIKSRKKKDGFFTHIGEHGATPSLAMAIDPFIARILPKGRTPVLGCTMRTLSHNLALLPPFGKGNVHWQHAPTLPKEDDEPLNLLLIPYPYRIRPNYFVGTQSNTPVFIRNDKYNRNIEQWGRFNIRQEWLKKKKNANTTSKDRKIFIQFISDLIFEARRECKLIHGVILPEYSLDWLTYKELAEEIGRKFCDIEFLVAGTSKDCMNADGNFVVSTLFFDVRLKDKQTKRIAATRSRRKHHRWRLDAEQIRTYQLASSLNPFVTWWECLEIGERDMYFTQIRKSSSFTTMICEDLARSDPAHTYLRALGPNLVFVLLMDGPQIPTRWPARYATVIADDPGSSVLTLTSYGLIERSNFNRSLPSHSIGLWRDDSGQSIELHCPRGEHAVLLTLSGKQADEITIDARPNEDSRAWRYHGHRSIKLSQRTIDENDYTWIFD